VRHPALVTMASKSETPQTIPPHPDEITCAVRKILFSAIPPATRSTLNLDNDQIGLIRPGIRTPYSLGLGPQRIDSLLGQLNKLMQQYQRTHSITTAELDQQNLVSDLCGLVIQHVQPDRT
jgi:hypothetical protein